MANILRLKRTSVAGRVPATSDLQTGELAVNIHDGKVFLKRDNGTPSIVEVGGGITDGDKGDITVSSSGTSWTIDSGAVSTAKMGGDVTAAGKALLDDASAAAQRVTLGLGTMATETAANYAPLASPAFTGTPTAPTALAHAETSQIATTAQVAGTVRIVPENAQTGTSYTLVLADAGKLVTLSNAAPVSLTVPANASAAFPTGTRIDLLQYGAGQVTVGGSGVTIRSSGSRLKLGGQYSGATLWKKASDEWVLIGDTVA